MTSENQTLGSLAFAKHNSWNVATGYNNIEITDLEHLAKEMNKGSVIGCSLEGGYRSNKNAISSLYAMFIDIDSTLAYENLDTIISNLNEYNHIRAPSKSHRDVYEEYEEKGVTKNRGPHKLHIAIQVDTLVSADPKVKKQQYSSMLSKLNIQKEWIDEKLITVSQCLLSGETYHNSEYLEQNTVINVVDNIFHIDEMETSHSTGVVSQFEEERVRKADPVIIHFNETHPIEEMLLECGYSYDEASKNYLSPSSTTGIAGVFINEKNEMYSHHGNDPINEMNPDIYHDAFDVFLCYKHKWDWKNAYSEATEMYSKYKSFGVHMMNNKFFIVGEGELWENLTRQNALSVFKKITNLKNEDFEKHLNIYLDGVIHDIDLIKPSGVFYEKTTRTITKVHNPTESWDVEGELDEAIISEFRDKIMDGELENLIKLIIHSIKLGERKLNKLLITGPSNKGKTELLNILMGFVTMSASEFTPVITQNKKWSQIKSKELTTSGLLLVDDISSELPVAFKNVEDTITFDIMNIGAIQHPCKFLAMTSTHDGIVQMVNEELRNRVLAIHIGGDFVFSDSILWKSNMSKYREHTNKYVKRLILEAIDDSMSGEDFSDLQEGYKLKNTNIRDEILDDIVTELKTRLGSGDISLGLIEHNGINYIKKRGTVKKVISELVELGFEGMGGVDRKKEKSFILDRFISRNQTTVFIQGKRVPCYEVIAKIVSKSYPSLG